MVGPRPSVLLVVAAGVLFGTAGTARAFGPADLGPTAIGILRIQVGALALFAVLPLLGVHWRRLPQLWRRPAIAVAALGAGLYQVLFFGSVGLTGVALGTLVAVGTEPVFAGIGGWLFLGHRPTRGWLAATSVAVAGLVLRSWDGLGTHGAGDGLGLLMALGAGLASAAWNLAAKHELDAGATSVEIPAASFTLGGLLLLPLLAVQPLDALAQPSGIGLALYLGIATMAFANVLLTSGIHGLPPGPAATLMLTDPVVATLLGVVVLGERLSVIASVGVVLVLAGLLLQGIAIARANPESLEPAPVL
jgi:DME family drug/metabolite transporter